MKILKTLFILVAVVIVLFTVVTLFLPSKVEMQRSRVINAPAAVIFNQVNDLHNWQNWSPWHQLDPQMTVRYSDDIAEGAGHWYSWEGNEAVGSGKLTIIESIPNSRIRTQMVFSASEEPTYSNWIFEEEKEGTKVTWTYDATPPGAAKWLGLVTEYFLAPAYETGLKNLDSVSTHINTPVDNTVEE
jgi:hypothetical protein